jgi:hypothetical protein
MSYNIDRKIIYPILKKKYRGIIRKIIRKTKTYYQIELRLKTGKVYYEKFQNYDEAFEVFKHKNIEFNLPIKNIIYDYGEYLEVLITKGKIMKFDRCDLDLIQNHCIYNIHKHANTSINGKNVQIHNLRIATKSQQNYNQGVRKNSITGIKYLLQVQDRGYRYWKVSIGKLKIQKRFSVKQYGEEGAKKMALEYLQKIKDEGKLNLCY